MKFSVDAFFTLGKTHAVCQDYARATVSSGRAFAVLCDGCSHSPDTDYGARLLAASAAMEIDPRGDKVILRAGRAARELGLPYEALDATLLTATGTPSGVRVSVAGDGVVVARHRGEDRLVACIYQHPQNAPAYLSYQLDPVRRESYIAEFGAETIVKTSRRSAEGPWCQVDTADEGLDVVFPARLFDLVMLLSDGAQSFQRVVETRTSRHAEPVPLESVIDQLVQIKSFAGSFMQRRCHGFLSRFCVEHRWQHTDDFSAAAIFMEEDR